jgi:hypothetical protein
MTMRQHTIPILSVLAVLLALPAVAHAQRSGHARGGYDPSRPVHVVTTPTRGGTRAEAVQRQLEREWSRLAALSRGYSDPTTDGYLADADAALRASSYAERQGRWGAMWHALDHADASLHAASARLDALYDDVASLRRSAARETERARYEVHASGPSAHAVARLLIDAERAQIEGEGAWIRGDYLRARDRFAEAIACVDEAYLVASRSPRGRVAPVHVREHHHTGGHHGDHDRQDSYLPASGRSSGRRGGYL